MVEQARAPASRVEVEALTAKLRKAVTRACPKPPVADPDQVLEHVVAQVLAARASRSPGDPIAGAEQWRIAWQATAEAIEDALPVPRDGAGMPDKDRLWAAARRELRRAELDKIDKRAGRDVALRERLAIARVFADHAASDEEETVDAHRIIATGDLPEELEDLDAATDRRGLLRAAAVAALLAAVLVALLLVLK